MLRSSLLLVTGLLMANPTLAQGLATPASRESGPDCRVRLVASPTGWIIQGYDPFDSGIPEGTFSVAFTNEGANDCRFVPVFQLDQPPFGLSDGPGKPIRYALLNITDSQDVTPRAGRSQRTLSQAEVVLAPRETRTLIFKLVAAPEDVTSAGTFTENVTIEAQDSNFRILGGTRLVLGVNVLPSARIGLSGAFTMNNGRALVDLGELRPGLAPVPLNLRISSTGKYEITVTSANAGRLRLGASEWYVPYALAIGGSSVNLSGIGTVSSTAKSGRGGGIRQDSVPIEFTIGDTSGRRAGTYSDVISVAVTAR